MKQVRDQNNPEFPFPTPAYRFDQKNDMFKRAFWDQKMQPYGTRFYREVEYQEKIGYRKIDYAFRNAAWNLEWGAGFGNSRSNSGLYSWEGVPAKIKHFLEAGGPVKESPENMSFIIKRAAHFFGADLVGICKIHPNWIYSHEYNTITQEHYPIEIPTDCCNAIIIGIPMDFEAIRTSPTAIQGAAVGLGYSEMVFVTSLLATFIRGIGYTAIPCGNDTALSIPLALAGGLGEYSRMGLLVTKEFGPRIRLSKVFTNLPLRYDSYRPFGVVEFCKTCKKCAEKCPSQAIPNGDMSTEGPNVSNHSGILKWYVNGEKCFAFWAKNRMDCSNCIRVCPYNKPSGMIHNIIREIIKNTSVLNNFFVLTDRVFGQKGYSKAKAFWDLSATQ
jgi:reductive dehalogenase